MLLKAYQNHQIIKREGIIAEITEKIKKSIEAGSKKERLHGKR